MKLLKNILAGFAVSFIGSIPLGYLNVIGYQVLQESGWNDLVWYLAGVMAIEAVVIYGTLVFAARLSKNEKLMKYIELFAIFFVLGVAYYFWVSGSNGELPQHNLRKYHNIPPVFVGMMFACFNFMQLPFWTGWNIYLVNQKFISKKKKYRLPYTLGGVVGTLTGMIAFILLLRLIVSRTSFLSAYLMPVIIPAAFVLLALFQAVKFYRKYHRNA